MVKKTQRNSSQQDTAASKQEMTRHQKTKAIQKIHDIQSSISTRNQQQRQIKQQIEDEKRSFSQKYLLS